MFYVLPPFKFGPVTLVGITFAAAVIFRILTMIWVIQLIIYTTDIRDLILSLIKIKCPVKLAMSLAIGFAVIPLVSDLVVDIDQAQKCRGWRGFGAGGLVERLKSAPVLLVPVMINTIERAPQIAASLETRAFGENIEARTFRREVNLHRIDYLIAVFGTVAIVVAVVWQIVGHGIMP